MSLQQAQAEGLCLRYPDNLGVHQSVNYEQAVSMLQRAVKMSTQMPYSWGYIDKPLDGQLYLLFLQSLGSFPNDGIRYQEQETRFPIPLGNNGELEVTEVKYGFVPGVDTSAWRVRRRYRLSKGGHPQLVLVHYTRSPQAAPIVPTLMNQPLRSYPLRPVSEPSIYVLGEKRGQTVYPQNTGSQPQPGGMGMNSFSAQAMLAQQNSNMESLERRRERERARERSASMTVGRFPPTRVEDDDSADETEHISARTLASTRYRRNHELMNDIFRQAAFGDKTAPPPSPPYSIFNQADLDNKVTKLSAEIEVLQRAADERKAAKSKAEAEARSRVEAEENADVTMDTITEGISV